MKKKLTLFLMVVLMLPLVALFGCDEVSSFGVTVYTSSSSYGYSTGSGTYNDGSTVTLTATAKTGGKFVGWIFQNTTFLEDGDTFSIETSEGQTRSTLTFVMSANTQGYYTAAFDSNNSSTESRMTYVKLSSYRVATEDAFTANPAGTTDTETAPDLLSANLSIAQGASSSNLTNVLTLDNATLKDNVIYTAENINQVLYLSSYNSRYVRMQFVGRVGTDTFNKDLRAELDFQTNFPETENANYTSSVNYSRTDGIYTITFSFENNNQTFYVVLNYENLK